MTQNKKASLKPSTKAAQAGIAKDQEFGAVMPPLYQSTNYEFREYGVVPKYDYARGCNPTNAAAALAIAEMEGADIENGAGAIMTSSGMAALDLVFNMLDKDDLLVAPHDCYGGTYRLIGAKRDKGHYKAAFVDQKDAAALDAVFAKNPKMILIETPSNPLLRITDIKDIVARAKKCGALVVVDNTFLSPVLQSPLEMGADLVVHSTTKYLNGHSDVVGGVVVASTAELQEQMRWWCNCVGYNAAAHESHMVLRGMRTLGVRMEHQEKTAHAIAELLAGHEAVARVYYPGLPDHPEHELAKTQQRGFGGMLSFELSGGEAKIKAFLDALEIFTLAESLGGFESLICHPASMTHRAMGPEGLAQAGVSMGLLRISAGLEDKHDLINALRDALEAL